MAELDRFRAQLSAHLARIDALLANEFIDIEEMADAARVYLVTAIHLMAGGSKPSRNGPTRLASTHVLT